MDFTRRLMPKIEKTTFDVSAVYFLLMFGYKLFSLYYPLFLVSIGLSVVKVGWTYLLIYATIAIASVGVNFYLHRVNPAKMAATGILGYAAYAFLMLATANITIFYLAQIMLGISAALWLTSFKTMLIGSTPKNYNSSFGWFYSAPEYASAFAPAIGGIIIYKFGFNGVFAASFLIQVANALYAYLKLRDAGGKTVEISNDFSRKNNFKIKNLKENYAAIFHSLEKDKIILVSLAAVSASLILGGIYRPYFILFLRELNYGQNEILAFTSLLSVVFIPLSWLAIKFIGKITGRKNISLGVAADGIVFVAIGALAHALNVIFVFILLLIDSVAGLMASSGKSGILAAKFAKFKEEISTIDNVMGTLIPAVGGLIGGVSISFIGYQNTFLAAGAFVFVFGLTSLVYGKDYKR